MIEKDKDTKIATLRMSHGPVNSLSRYRILCIFRVPCVIPLTHAYPLEVFSHQGAHDHIHVHVRYPANVQKSLLLGT